MHVLVSLPQRYAYVASCATYACIPLHDLSCRHERTCMICHIGTRVAAQRRTYSFKQWHVLHTPYPVLKRHEGTWTMERARNHLWGRMLVQYLDEPPCLARNPQGKVNIGRRSKTRNKKWRFHRPLPHILCTGDDYAQGGEYERKYNMVPMCTPSTRLPEAISLVHTLGSSGRGAHGQGGRAGRVMREQEHKLEAR